MFVPALFEPWAHLLVDAAVVGTGDRVLDVACGTGIVARTAADRVGNTGAVVGIDRNPAMLAVTEQHSAPTSNGVKAMRRGYRSSLAPSTWCSARPR